MYHPRRSGIFGGADLRTAQLPGIRLDRPKKVIGKNTVDCMRSGIMYGTAAMLDGMLDRVEEELGYSTTVVATGGMAPVYRPPVPQRDDAREGSAAEGVEYPLQKESPGAEKRRGMR